MIEYTRCGGDQDFSEQHAVVEEFGSVRFRLRKSYHFE
jgi:hypothetical protein